MKVILWICASVFVACAAATFQPCEPTPVRISRAEACEVADDETVIGLMLLRSSCSCKHKNCFSVVRQSLHNPSASICAMRKQRRTQGYSRGGRGEGPWLAKVLYNSRQYVGGRKPYKVNYSFENISVCRFAWECLHGLPPGSSRISTFVAAIRKGKDPSLPSFDARVGSKQTQRNMRMKQWAARHIVTFAECSPVGSEPRMHVPKMTHNDRHKMYLSETSRERRATFGPVEQHQVLV